MSNIDHSPPHRRFTHAKTLLAGELLAVAGIGTACSADLPEYVAPLPPEPPITDTATESALAAPLELPIECSNVVVASENGHSFDVDMQLQGDLTKFGGAVLVVLRSGLGKGRFEFKPVDSMTQTVSSDDHNSANFVIDANKPGAYLLRPYITTPNGSMIPCAQRSVSVTKQAVAREQ